METNIFMKGKSGKIFDTAIPTALMAYWIFTSTDTKNLIWMISAALTSTGHRHLFVPIAIAEIIILIANVWMVFWLLFTFIEYFFRISKKLKK